VVPDEVCWSECTADDPPFKRGLTVADAITGVEINEPITRANQAEGWYDRLVMIAPNEYALNENGDGLLRERVYRDIRIVAKCPS